MENNLSERKIRKIVTKIIMDNEKTNQKIIDDLIEKIKKVTTRINETNSIINKLVSRYNEDIKKIEEIIKK